LQLEVKELLAEAEAADAQDQSAGLDIPAEMARREKRLAAKAGRELYKLQADGGAGLWHHQRSDGLSPLGCADGRRYPWNGSWSAEATTQTDVYAQKPADHGLKSLGTERKTETRLFSASQNAQAS
jgi:hypothetical protein